MFFEVINFFDAGKVIGPTGIGIGAFLLGMVSFTQYKGVKETKNTVFLEKKFMIGQLWTCFFLGFASVWSLCSPNWSAAKEWIFIDSAMVMINIILFYVNFYTLRTKLANMEAAKKAGMTEAEHYDKVIAPSLKLKANS